MSLRRLSINAVASSGTIIVAAVLLFELYRFLARTIGIEQIGAWSLLVACASLVRLGEFGLVGSVVKFVASELGAKNKSAAANTAMMSIIIVAFGVGIACFILWPVVNWLLVHSVANQALLELTQQMLPWVLAATWMASVVTTLAGAIDGAQRTDMRAIMMVCGSVVQLLLVYAYVPTQGLFAMAPIQFAFVAFQAVLLLLALIWILRREQCPAPRWRTDQLKNLLRYGGGYQLNAIGQILFEPTVRWLLGAFASLTLIGYYELANRAIAQFRQVITAAYQMLVPFIANRFGASNDQAKQSAPFYREALHLLLIVILPYFALIGGMLPFGLTFWAGEYAPEFVWIGVLCLTGWFVNTLAVPAFMLYLSIGRLRWVVANQLTIGVLNVVFAGLGGAWFGGPGVVIGAMSALAIGSLVVITQFHREYDVKLAQSFPNGMGWLIFMGLSVVVGSAIYALAWQGSGPPSIIAVVSYLALAIGLGFVVWQDPLRQNLTERLLLKP
ncbi:MAG: lipopolysaccharide biosynthesis protein [Burkholderiaceae bacterium]